MEKQKLIEILAAVNLLVLLLILVFVAFAVSDSKNYSPNIENSYNVNSYNTHIYESPSPLKPYVVHDGRIYLTDRNRERIYYEYEPDRFDYSSHAKRETSESVLGSELTRYKVYVENHENVGGYFTVKFYFKNYYGNVESETITHYVKARDIEMFQVRYFEDKYSYRDWWYEVFPRSKAPDSIKIYYN